MPENKRLYLLGGIMLLGFSLAAWGPLFRDYLLVDNDIWSIEMLPRDGIWRVLGRLGFIWSVSLPGFWPGAISVAAHFLASFLLFAACHSVWGNFRISLLTGLLYCIYPWGYGLMTAGWAWPLSVEVCFLLAVVIWAISRCRHPSAGGWLELPVVSLLVVVAIATQERLSFCYPMLSAWALWVLWSKRHEGSGMWLKASALAMAPVAGFAIYTVLYLLTKESDVNTPGFHLPALLSTFVKQFRHYHHFVPLASPSVWSSFVFYEWSEKQVAVVLLGGLAGVGALFLAMRGSPSIAVKRDRSDLSNFQKIGLSGALLLGAAAIFVVAGGYSDEIYKRYPIGSLLAFSLCGVLTYLPGFPRLFASLPAKLTLAGLIAVFIFTDWLHAGIWRYEVRSIHRLVDLLHEESLPIPADLKWAKEPRAFWPQLDTMTEAMRRGQGAIEDVKFLYAHKFSPERPTMSPDTVAIYSAEEEWSFHRPSD